MIFKTINSSVDNTRKTLSLFNKDWNTYKTNWQQGFSQNGISGGIKSIFQSSNSNSVISKDQLQILRNWNNAVAHGCTNQKTFNSIIKDADDNTKLYFSGLNKGKGSVEGLKNAQNVAKQSTIGLTLAQTALNAAISLGFTAALMLAVKGLDKLINSAKRASEAADEAFSDTTEKVQKNEDEAKSLDELISKYKELKESENLDVDGRKEIKEIQNDIADLVGVQASNLDLVNGKLDDEIAKLDEISAKEAKNAYETATANYNNSKKSADKATGDDSFLFVDGYAYTGKREKKAEKVLKNAGFGGNVQSGGFFGNTLFIMDSSDNDMKELKGAQEKADYLQSMIDILEQNGQRATDLYAGLISQRDKYLQYIDNQQDAANSLVNSWISYSQFSNNELSKINVDSVDSFEEYRQKMIDEAKKDESIGKMLADGTLSDKDLENAVNDFMATSTKFSTWYEQWIGNVQSSTLNETPISSDIFSLKDANGTLTTLGKISESIDTIQNAFSTLNSAIDEYNNSGSISIDTLQSIIALGDNWYDYLLDENGALKLDKESLQKLTASRLADMKAQIQQNMIDNVKNITDDASAKEYLASTNYQVADSIGAVTEAMVNQTLVEKQSLVQSGDLSQNNYDLIEEKLKGDIEKTNLLFNNLSLDDVSLGGGSSSGSGSGSSSSKSSNTKIDFIEYRLKELDELTNKVQSSIDEAVNAGDKNALLGQMQTVDNAKIDTYNKAISYYQKEASNYLEKIPAELREAAKNGAIAITEFIGDNSSEIADYIQQYRDLDNSIAEATEQVSSLRQEVIKLEKEKFDNIVNAFDSIGNIISSNKSIIESQITYLETSGERIGKGYYTSLKDQSKLYLEQLNKERDVLNKQLSTAMSNGVKYGSDEWKDMYSSIQNVDQAIIDTKNDIEGYNNSLRELDWTVFDDAIESIDTISNKLSNLLDLLKTDKVSGDFSGYSKDAITSMSLNAQKMQTANYVIEKTNKEIANLKASYNKGELSVSEYTERLESLENTLWDNISTYNSAKEAIIEIAKARINEEVEAIEKVTEANNKRISKLKEELQAEKDLQSYKRSLLEKQNDISKLQAQINARMGSTDAETIAEREKLEQELADKLKEIKEMQEDQAYDDMMDSLDKEQDAFEEAQQKKIDTLITMIIMKNYN